MSDPEAQSEEAQLKQATQTVLNALNALATRPGMEAALVLQKAWSAHLLTRETTTGLVRWTKKLAHLKALQDELTAEYRACTFLVLAGHGVTLEQNANPKELSQATLSVEGQPQSLIVLNELLSSLDVMSLGLPELAVELREDSADWALVIKNYKAALTAGAQLAKLDLAQLLRGPVGK